MDTNITYLDSVEIGATSKSTLGFRYLYSATINARSVAIFYGLRDLSHIFTSEGREWIKVCCYVNELINFSGCLCFFTSLHMFYIKFTRLFHSYTAYCNWKCNLLWVSLVSKVYDLQCSTLSIYNTCGRTIYEFRTSWTTKDNTIYWYSLACY